MNSARKGYVKYMMNKARSFNADISNLPDGTVKGTTTVGGEKFEVIGPTNSSVMSDLHAQVAERFRAGGLPTLTQTDYETTKDV